MMNEKFDDDLNTEDELIPIPTRDLNIVNSLLVSWKNKYGLTMVKRKGLVKSSFSTDQVVTKKTVTNLNSITLRSLNKCITNATKVYEGNKKYNVLQTIKTMKRLKADTLKQVRSHKLHIAIDQYKKEFDLRPNQKPSFTKFIQWKEKNNLKFTELEVYEYLASLVTLDKLK